MTDESFIEKGPGRGGVQQLVEQYKYIASLEEPFKRYFPIVRDLWTSRDNAGYMMEYIPYPTLRDCLLGNPDQGMESIFDTQKAITAVKNASRVALGELAISRTYEPRADYLESYIYGKYRQRIEETRSIIAQLSLELTEDIHFLKILKGMLDADVIVVDKREYENPGRVLMQVQQAKNSVEVLTPNRLYHVHGDLHFENIKIDPSDEQLSRLKLIDPRGFPSGADIAYDIGKLLHSCNGKYDFLHREWFVLEQWQGINVRVWEKPDYVETKMRGGGSGGSLRRWSPILKRNEYRIFDTIHQELEGILNELFAAHEQLRADKTLMIRSYLMEALHFCTMMPFHIEESPRRAVAIYATGVVLINKWWERYREDLGWPQIRGFTDG